MPGFLERYRSGLHRPVWDELIQLGNRVREPEIVGEALEVVRETMTRVRRSLETLVPRLQDEGFQFGLYPDGEEVPGYRAPLLPPDPDIERKVRELEALAGQIPLSLYGFWKWVGSVNLVGRHLKLTDISNTLDPLWVDRIDLTLAEYSDWRQRCEQFGDEEPFGALIAPDDLHKDNVSGGAPYEIELPNPAVDAVIRNEGSDSYFVDYLRNSLDWAGYPGFAAAREVFPEWLDRLSEDVERF